MTASALATTSVDAIIVGAGVAGLAAAATLRRAGRSVMVLEAGTRIGGRAFTSSPAPLGGDMVFDHGASWLHAAHRNPLADLIRARGDIVHPDLPWEGRIRFFTANGAPATIGDYARAEAGWRDAVTARLAGPDCSLAEAATDVATDPWTATIEAWEGAIIAAADADLLSLRDWHANALEGENLVAPGGLGAALARCLGAEAGHVQFSARVTRVEAQTGGIRVHTSDGRSVRAGAVIVTVSTGVLRAEAIAFSPALPDDILDALNGLPMGLLTKIALRAGGTNRLGLAPGTDVFRRPAARGAPALSIIFWPEEAPLAIGFCGGRMAWALAGKADDAREFFHAELAATLGTQASAAFAPDRHLATSWGTDANFLGAYAYATPGHAGARETLGVPIWDGRLAFAGEACSTDGLAGTVAGAFLSGTRAGTRAGTRVAWRP